MVRVQPQLRGFRGFPLGHPGAVFAQPIFRVGQNLAVGVYQRVGAELHMIDYWEGSNKDGIPQAIKALQNKPYIYGKHFFPHDAQATEQATGKTRLDTAKELWKNQQFEITPRISVDDGIARGRAMFSHLWINETNCQQWLDYIAQYRQEWDEDKGMFKPKPLHDFTSHAADVHRYAAIVEDKMGDDDEPMPDQDEPNSDIYDD